MISFFKKLFLVLCLMLLFSKNVYTPVLVLNTCKIPSETSIFETA